MTDQGRYSKLSEEEAASQFEMRKQQILGNLLEQYESSKKNKQASKILKPQINQQEFIILNPKKVQLKNPKHQSKELKCVKDESSHQISTSNPVSDVEQIEQIQQNVESTPITKIPIMIKCESENLKKILLKDIGNIDLEIKKLKRETIDFEMNKQTNKSQVSFQCSNTKDITSSINPCQNSSQKQQQSKVYYELRQRPSSKESRISDSSYTKKAVCFKGIVRSQSLQKLSQQQQSQQQQKPQNSNQNVSKQKNLSEKKKNSSMNKTITLESENKDPSKKSNQIAQSERKASKPTIQINRSQSRQDSPQIDQKSSSIKSILKVQFSSIPFGSKSTKNNSTIYHKKSYNSQINLSKNKCVEVQIQEAVQLYNNLKFLIQNKSNGNQMPKNTVEFFQNKEIVKPKLF